MNSILDLETYEKDFAELEILERRAMEDLARVASLPQWEPTDYERLYLPGLRLAGLGNREDIILQNTADLHLHTQWSDGDDLDRVLEQAQRMRLDVIAITDHNEIAGAFEARRRVHERKLPLAVVPGCEISSSDGHIGALFVMRVIPRGLPAAETVRLIHEAGGIAVAHHPYSPKWIDKLVGEVLGCGDLIMEVPFDAVECTNAVPGRGVKYNIEAVEAMRRKRISVAVTGGSDAHLAEFVGKGRTYFAGNQGVLSLRLSLQLGFTSGAEGYWKTREKINYHGRLIKGILSNVFHREGSVN